MGVLFSNLTNRFRKAYQGWTKQANQKYTILLVPHGKDQSISFHFTFLQLTFFICLTTVVLFLSVYFVYLNHETQSEVKRLTDLYGRNSQQYWEIAQEYDSMQKKFIRTEKNLVELFSWMDGPVDEVSKLDNEEELREEAGSQLILEALADPDMTASSMYLDEIQDFRTLKLSLLSRKRLLDSALSYWEKKESIYQSIPLGHPIPNFHLTSGYGHRRSPVGHKSEFHDGVDLANSVGTPIYATAPGIVSRVSYQTFGYGYHILISHEFGYITLYGHCSKIFVKLGDKVNLGQLIGEVGSTGNVTGPHLHYEVWIGEGNKQDPMEYLQKRVNDWINMN
jgi:murein DD-endopeptidase MepM/ murein hydrolase activator NlpD